MPRYAAAMIRLIDADAIAFMLPALLYMPPLMFMPCRLPLMLLDYFHDMLLFAAALRYATLLMLFVTLTAPHTRYAA